LEKVRRSLAKSRFPLATGLRLLDKGLVPLSEDRCQLSNDRCQLSKDRRHWSAVLFLLAESLCLSTAFLVFLATDLLPLVAAPRQRAKDRSPLAKDICPVAKGRFSLTKVRGQVTKANRQLTKVRCKLSKVLCSSAKVRSQLSTALCPLATDRCQLAKELCPLSKAVFQEEEVLFLMNEGQSFFAEAGGATWEGLLLVSKPGRLEFESLFIGAERPCPTTLRIVLPTRQFSPSSSTRAGDRCREPPAC
jgi:hypothetical protein